MIAIRTDASDRIGTGHVIRCLALADVLRERGDDVRFVCRRHSGHLIGLIEGRGYRTLALESPEREASTAGEDYRAWLGVSPETDASHTIASLGSARLDWVIVDHYALDRVWEEALRNHTTQILVIDDLADREHDCDLLLDQTYSPHHLHRYRDLVPRHCEVLSGPRHALLAKEYADWRPASPRAQGPIARVLVYFGGSDAGNLSGLALDVLARPAFMYLEVDVVIGANNPHRRVLESQVRARPRTHLHGARPHLADLMAVADVAIGAGGVTTWERMCVGVPAVVVCLARNQQPTCEALSAAGLIQYLGGAAQVGAVEIAAGLAQLIEQPGRLAAMSAGGRDLVDGRGAWRVAAAMRSPTESQAS